MSEENYQKFATQTMIEVAKLLITLASGFFVLSTTLINIISNDVNDPVKAFWTIIVAWACLIVSIGSGILALGGIATSAHDDNKFDVDTPVTCWTLRAQQVFFVVAFLFVAWFAYSNV